MRGREVRFWRVVFAASVVLFVVGAGMTVVASASGGSVNISPKTSLVFGQGAVGVMGSSVAAKPGAVLEFWTPFVTDPVAAMFGPEYMHRPWYMFLSTTYRVLVPAYYIPALAVLTGVTSAVILCRHKKKIAAGLCAGCGYSLAGLPADAAACPECGGKIGKSTAEAR
jgi:hypothetical protein